MSLAQIQKALFFTRPSGQQQLLDLLQTSGTVHLAPGDAVLPEGARPFFDDVPGSAELRHRIGGLEKRLQDLDAVIAVLTRYEPHTGLAARLASPRTVTSLEAFNALARFDEAPVTTALADAATLEQEARGQLDLLRQQRARLALLAGLPTPLEQFADTPHCFVAVITAARSAWHTLADDLAGHLGMEGDISVLAASPERVVACVVGRRQQRGTFATWVDTHPVVLLDLAGRCGTAADALARLDEEEWAWHRQVDAAEAQRAALAVHLPVLREAYDYWSSRLEQLKKAELVRTSRYTAVAGGWIRAGDVATLEAQFSSHGLDVVTMVADPAPGDDPPVAYDNPPLVRPFEFISDLYSRPHPGERDPTPYLAGFFVFSVALCLTDAGYGLVLAMAAYLLLRRAKSLTPDDRKLVRILFYCGLGTVLVGLLTGGIFGLAPAALPGPLGRIQGLVVLNPMENQMGFLVFTLALGVVQVALGIFLKLRWNLRHRQAAAAWLDQAPWLLLIVGVVLVVLAGNLGPAWLAGPGYGALIVAAAVILLFAGRDAKHPLKRLAAGLFSLYQVSGLFGDVLSYVRLFALGLATGVIASVVNFIAQLVLGVPYVGVVLMLLVLVLGHLVNIAINALGGFIHTTRLQFVEFFGKFYEGGGKPFDAFQLKTRYTTVLDLGQ